MKLKIQTIGAAVSTFAFAGLLMGQTAPSFAQSSSNSKSNSSSSSMNSSSSMSSGSSTMASGNSSMQMAKVAILSPGQGDTIPSSHYVVELKITVPANDVKAIAVKPAFVTPTNPHFKPGRSVYFPGLVVTDTGTVAKVGGPMRNIAGLFQVIGVRHNLSGSEIIDVDWFVGKPLFSGNSMPCIRAWVVKGKAPSMIPMNPTNMDIGKKMKGMTLISNVAKTDFYTAKGM